MFNNWQLLSVELVMFFLRLLMVVNNNHMSTMGANVGRMRFLSFSLKKKVQCYNEYFINEYFFHTKQYGKVRKTYNIGACVNDLTSN